MKNTTSAIAIITVAIVLLLIMPPNAKAISLFDIFDIDTPDCFTLFGLRICGDSGNPYSSSQNASGLVGTISRARIPFGHLSNSHDISTRFVGPAGHQIFRSDARGSSNIENVMLTFNDTGSSSLPYSAQLRSGTFRPAGYGAGDGFDSDAPSGAYGALLSAFRTK